MRKVILIGKIIIIKSLVDNNGNRNTTAIKLVLSKKQISRFIIYKEKEKIS